MPVLPWKYVPHVPTPKQAVFLHLDAFDIKEAFYGGAGGGGKSDALLMAALRYVEIPGYAALLLRKSFSDLSLPGALMDRASEWLMGTDATFNMQDHKWTFPSGATLTFGYMDTYKDMYRYQSAEFQFIGFDELTQFPEERYRYLFSRLRRLADSDVPLRVRSASNPGGEGHDWVKARFILGGAPEAKFVPARIPDNPHIDQEAYTESLANLDPVTRAQMEEGNWDVGRVGGMFQRQWLQFLDEPPTEVFRWTRAWDLAATDEEQARETNADYTAGALIGMGRGPYEGSIVIADMQRFRKAPGERDNHIRTTAQMDQARYGNVAIRIEEEGGASGKSQTHAFATRVLDGMDFRGVRATGDKTTRAAPFSAAASNRLVYVVRGAWNGDLIDELESFPEGAYDDQVDACSLGFNELRAGRMATAVVI